MVRFIILFLYLVFTISCQKTSKESKEHFDLDTLPQKWVALTKTDTGLIIYNSCDGGNRLISILKNKSNYGLLLHGQQEDYEYIIEKVFKQSKDTILIETKWKDSEEKEVFKFIWSNKEKGLGVWTYSFVQNPVFVTSDRQKDYPVFNQPCVECFGEDCDEIEKLSKEKPENTEGVHSDGGKAKEISDDTIRRK